MKLNEIFVCYFRKLIFSQKLFELDYFAFPVKYEKSSLPKHNERMHIVSETKGGKNYECKLKNETETNFFLNL